jgi:chromosome segregation ATPase
MKWLGYSLFLAILLWPACGTGEKAQTPNQSQEAEAARRERRQYQKKIETKLRELDQKIDALKVRTAKHSKVARNQLDRQMSELDQKREVAHQEFEKLRNSSQGAWQDMKAGIDAAMDNLETAYERAASHFK